MARFRIVLEDGKALIYETADSSLFWEGGDRVDLSVIAKKYEPLTWPVQEPFSHDSPIGKVRKAQRLKIQLGLGCNYSCSYCSQGAQRHKGESTSTADTRKFLESLDSWLEGEPEIIELWGGEPLLYWVRIKILAPALREKFPNAKLSIISNGSLLTNEIVDFLDKWKISFCISHDGPGQSLRGEDPFEKKGWTTVVRRLFATLGGNASFNAVITPSNMDLKAILDFFEDRMGSRVQVNIEDAVSAYEGGTNDDFSVAGKLDELAATMERQILDGTAFRVPSILGRIDNFMESISGGKRLVGSGQWCGMDRKDSLAVDLAGNVLTCQNVGAKGGHLIGHVSKFDEISLDTSEHWSYRKGCASCPVVHMCYGSCMFLQGAEFDASCQNSYHYNMGLLKACLFLLSGSKVVSIDHQRKERKVIPIRLIHD